MYIASSKWFSNTVNCWKLPRFSQDFSQHRTKGTSKLAFTFSTKKTDSDWLLLFYHIVSGLHSKYLPLLHCYIAFFLFQTGTSWGPDENFRH